VRPCWRRRVATAERVDVGRWESEEQEQPIGVEKQSCSAECGHRTFCVHGVHVLVRGTWTGWEDYWSIFSKKESCRYIKAMTSAKLGWNLARIRFASLHFFCGLK